MTDHHLRFLPPMILAMLRDIEQPGTGKTMTRLALKLPTKTASGGPIYERRDMGGWEPTTMGGAGCRLRDGAPAPELVGIWHQTTGVCMSAPIQPGARIWVRETWKLGLSDHRCAGYRADMTYQCGKPIPVDGRHRWRSSTHMPRWASRLTLYVTDVRIERLQDISEGDALAEGVECDTDGWRDYQMPGTQCCADPVASYRTLWESINGPGAWAQNPWVSVTTYVPRLGNIDALPATLAEAV